MGQVIGAVVADTQVHAQRAAKVVKVEYEELEPVITIKVRSYLLFTFWKYIHHIPFFNIIRLVILLTLVKCSFQYLSLTFK